MFNVIPVLFPILIVLLAPPTLKVAALVLKIVAVVAVVVMSPPFTAISSAKVAPPETNRVAAVNPSTVENGTV
jgi:hypothetical protein